MFKRKKAKITVEDIGVDANGWLNAPLMNRSLNGRWTFLIDIASRNGKSNYIVKDDYEKGEANGFVLEN